MSLKKTIIKIFLLSELMCFNYLYFFGPNGIRLLKVQQSHITMLIQKIENNETEIDHLKKEIYAWQTNDFYKEKVAREQLQMARKDDKLFYIGM